MKFVSEGKAKVFIHSGEATRKLPVFYNPEMEQQRNITIACLNVYFKNKFSMCDPLAGSGVRGIRILKETKCSKVVFNDMNLEAVKLIKKNLEKNKLKAEVFNMDAKDLLFENKSKFDFVDIDPFGPPVRYLEAAAFSLKDKSFFVATATDTGALAGSFPKACFRKYQVKVCKTDFLKELGVRVLITKIQMDFSKQNKKFIPLLNHHAHYFRVVGKVGKGKNLKEIGFVSYCGNCLYRCFNKKRICPNCKKKLDIFGPIWLGQIQDNEFCREVLRESKKMGFKFKCIEEIKTPFYYDLHRVFKKLGKTGMKKELVLEKLEKAGFKVSESSLCPTGIKTNAGIREIEKILN